MRAAKVIHRARKVIRGCTASPEKCAGRVQSGPQGVGAAGTRLTAVQFANGVRSSAILTRSVGTMNATARSDLMST